MATSKRDHKREIKRATRRYAQALSDLSRAWLALHEDEDHGAARPGSNADRDGTYLSEWCGENYADPGGSIASLISARMSVASDHLSGTAQLFTPKDTGIFSVWATARSCLEMLSIVYWMTEPDLSPEDRLGRVINDRLVSLSGAARLIQRGEISAEDIETDPGERAADVQARAERLGYELEGSRYGPQVVPQRPGFTALVDELAGEGVYSMLSGMSHGEVWAIGRHQQVVEGVEDPAGQGRQLSQLSVTLSDYQSLAGLLIASHREATVRVVNYFGWDDDDYATQFRRSSDQVMKAFDPGNSQ